MLKSKCRMVIGPAGQLAECRAILLLLFFSPPAQSRRQENYARHTKLWLQRQFTLLPWCCGQKPHFLFAEPWKGVGKKCCLPGIFCDSGDTPANLLCELNGHLVSCASCFDGKWVKDVCTGQFGVLLLLLCYFIGE